MSIVEEPPSLIIQCGQCEAKFDVGGIPAGKAVKCGACKALLEVPAADEAERTIQIDPRAEDPAASNPSLAPAATLRRRRADLERRGDSGRRKASPPGGGLPIPPVAIGVGVLVLLAAIGLAVIGTGGQGDGAATPVAEVNLEAEFADRKLAAGKDVEQLMGVVSWAAGHDELANSRKRLLGAIVALDPDHQAANEALGRAKLDGRWVKKEVAEKELARRAERRAAIAEQLGEKMIERKAARFDVYLQPDTSYEAAESSEMLDAFIKRLDTYAEGWWQRKREDLPAYTGELVKSEDPRTLPRMRLALVTDDARYRRICETREMPLAANQGGFYDRDKEVIYLRHNPHQPKVPFYDSFLFSAITEPWEGKNSERTSNDYIVWMKGLDSFEYLGEDVHVGVSRHFLVALQQGETYAAVIVSNEYKRVLDALYRHFATEYADVLKGRERMELVPIYIFRNRAGYLQYGKEQNKLGLLQYAGGHYDGKLKIMMTFRKKNTSPIEVVLHEATHVLMHYLKNHRPKKVTDLFWLQEGIADFCAGFRATADGIELGKINRGRWKAIKQIHALEARQRRRTMTFQQLINYHQGHWFGMLQSRDPRVVRSRGQQMGIIYAKAWALFHFLHHGNNGKYRQRLKAFIRSSIESDQSINAFNKAFAGISMQELEREFYRYVDQLQDED